jgi:methylmalonyl-CoA mutase cobalamin-binding subunit
MASVLSPDPPLLRIAQVERWTGIPRATLRTWERRYGFPEPQRDERGERCYSQAQLQRLRLIWRLVARRRRPVELVQLSVDELERMLVTARDGPFGRDPLVALLRAHEPFALQSHLLQLLALDGLEAFVCDKLAAFNTLVGDAWAAGELEVFEEHFYVEAVTQVVRTGMAALPPAAARPRVVLATLPNEPHGLGLLMVEAMLRIGGCGSINLGARVPVDQLLAAADAFGADVLALSVSSAARPQDVLEQLHDIAHFRPALRLWIGGAGCSEAFGAVPGIRRFGHVRETRAAIAQWRAEAQG